MDYLHGPDPKAEQLASLMPWPYFRTDRNGKLSYANAHFELMLEGYGLKPDTPDLNELFETEESEQDINGILKRLGSEQAWHGRWLTRGSDHLFSFDLMLQVDTDQDDSIWGIILENPIINNEVILPEQSEEKLLQTLLNHTLDYLYLIDPEGRLMISNQAFQNAIRVPYPGFETGKTLDAFVSEETSRQFSNTDKQVLTTHKPLINHISLFRLNNNDAHWVQTTKMPVFDLKQNCIGLVCVARDISELKNTTKRMRQAMRKAEAANKAKSDFLANMSHEIRTPINGIMGMTELCIDTNINEEQKEYLDSVLSCSHTLLKIINDILDFSKIESGKLEIENIEFDLHGCLKEVCAHMRPLAAAKKVVIELEIQKGTPHFVRGDPTRLRQILYNLCNNAVKFTDKGSVIIRCLQSGLSFPKPNICIEVEDTGIGIPKNRQKEIFESFTQADTSTTRRFGGTGLGLSVCKQLVGLMQGRISLESETNEGSLFQVKLPFELVKKSQFKNSNDHNRISNLSGSSLDILLAEDNPVNQDVAIKRLTQMGHRVLLAENGNSAVELFNNMEFDLVIMDIHMPVLDGIEAVQRIRAIEAQSKRKRIPIIAMTARALEDDINEGLESGFDHYIIKPFKSEALTEVLNAIHSKAETEQKAQESKVHRHYGRKPSSFIDLWTKLNQRDKEDIAFVSEVFLGEYEAELATLDKALTERDKDGLLYQIHRLRGSLCTLGNQCISDEMEILENTLVDAIPDGIENEIEKLKQSTLNLVAEIKKTLQDFQNIHD